MASLGEQAVGSIVQLNFNGAATDFIVVHQGRPSTAYDSSCNGTWLLIKNIYAKRQWQDDYKGVDYANSSVHSYLNNTILDLFDSDVKSMIRTVKLPYTKWASHSDTLTVATGSSGVSAKLFLLSYAETGFTNYSSDYAKQEGAALSYFSGAANSMRIATYNGAADYWWLRSTYTDRYDYIKIIIKTGGSSQNDGYGTQRGIRFAFLLPTSFEVGGGAISGEVNINGVTHELTGEGYVNINGVLCPLDDSGVNIGGIMNSMGG